MPLSTSTCNSYLNSSWFVKKYTAGGFTHVYVFHIVDQGNKSVIIHKGCMDINGAEAGLEEKALSAAYNGGPSVA